MTSAVDLDNAVPASSPSARAPRWLRVIFIANLVAQTGIVITGGIVRLTGSGLGCPTWPECAPGSFTPTTHQAEAWHKYVEFGNRLLTFVLGILAIAAVIGALRWRAQLKKRGLPRRTPVVLLAAVPLLGTIVQAVLGGITVLTGLNPATVAAHFLLSIVLIGACVILVRRANEPGDEPVVKYGVGVVRVLSTVLVVVSAVVVILGTIVTGSGPHSGDAETPARFNLDPAQMSWLHADAVILFVGLIIAMLVAVSLTQAPAATKRDIWILFGVSLAQGLIGYVQYFTGLPWVLVAVHMLGATLVWIATVRIPLSLRTRGIAPAAPTESAAAVEQQVQSRN